MTKYQYSKGVSLIELLVVIAIIGIFAAVGTQGYRSIVTGSDFVANKTALTQYLNDIRYKSYADNKHYKILIDNFDDNLIVKLYEPDDLNTKWRNLNLVRRCNCQSSTGHADPDCNQSFSNVAVSLLTSIAAFDKTINNINIVNCNNDACSTETPDPVEICYLFDGTTPSDLFFKVSASATSFAIYKINKTGYVE